jgi:hypothetical protein
MDGGWQRLKVAKSHGRLSRVLAELGHSPCRPLLTQNLMAAADPQTHIEIVSDVPPGTSKPSAPASPELGPISSMFLWVCARPPVITTNFRRLSGRSGTNDGDHPGLKAKGK